MNMSKFHFLEMGFSFMLIAIIGIYLFCFLVKMHLQKEFCTFRIELIPDVFFG